MEVETDVAIQASGERERLAPDTVIANRYRLIELLKRREKRVHVLKAIDETTGDIVKIKHMSPKAGDRWERREAELLLRLNHPRVPRPLGRVEAAGGTCYVQTFFEGPTYRQLLREHGRMTELEVVAMLRSGLELLAYLHAQPLPVIHRDIKPANMVRLPTGEVALIDFGIARVGTRDKHVERVKDLTQAHTVGYAPPEQVIGLEALPVADTYALGATALYLLSGVHPIRLWDAQTGRLVAPASVDPALASLLHWMTAPAVAERCPSAVAAFEALARLA